MRRPCNRNSRCPTMLRWCTIRPRGMRTRLQRTMASRPRRRWTVRRSSPVEPHVAAPVGDVRRRMAMRLPRMAGGRPRVGWPAVYDVTPDSDPILDRFGPDGLCVAVGFSGHGFKLSPAVGRLLAEFVATGKRPEALVPLRASRFAEKQPVHADAPFPAGGRRRIP